MSSQSLRIVEALGDVDERYIEEASDEAALAGIAEAADEAVAAANDEALAAMADGTHASGVAAGDKVAGNGGDAADAEHAEFAESGGMVAIGSKEAPEKSPHIVRPRWRRSIVAAAACLVIVAGIGALVWSQGTGTPSAPLEDVAASSASGSAAASATADAVAADKPEKSTAADVVASSEAASTAEGVSDADAADVRSYDMTGENLIAGGMSSSVMRSGDGTGAAATGAATADATADGKIIITDPVTDPAEPADETPYANAEAGVLTAAEWNDNANWPFFTNLVNAGTIGFPSFGIDPRNRIKATVTDEAGSPLRGQSVELRSADGAALWQAQSDKNGVAYLFYAQDAQPATVAAAGMEQSLTVEQQDPDDRQGKPVVTRADDVVLAIPAASASGTGASSGDVQVMFIVDTTGSMADELAYLQKDFIAIAQDAGGSNVSYSANFYRDEGDDYVTKRHDFTTDVATVQQQISAEYADGGGDEPEAVAQILTETLTDNTQWRTDAAKIAFLVFDAPPHEGTDAQLVAAVESAAAQGIVLVPVVASNANRETELFGRALAICTNGTYVFLTDDSGVGDSHLEPIVGAYTVESLHDVIVRLIKEVQ